MNLLSTMSLDMDLLAEVMIKLRSMRLNELEQQQFLAGVRELLRREPNLLHQIQPQPQPSCQIPAIFRRTVSNWPQKQTVFNRRPTKKSTSKCEDSLLNLDEQVKMNINILNLENELGCNIVQKNGQRTLGGPPPGWIGPPPGPGSEVFVGRIPRNIYEDRIYPIFSKIGKIYELRLMMNFSGTNRGFCFIMYENPQLAQRAIRELDNYEICSGWSIGVVQSVNNCRLHVTGLPPHVEPEKLFERIWPACEDLDKISVYTNLSDPSSKHALISFKTHRSAAMARRSLLPERSRFFDRNDVKIEWAHPKITITNAIEESVYLNENRKTIITRKILGDRRGFSDEEKKFRNAHKRRLLPNINKHQNLSGERSQKIDHVDRNPYGNVHWLDKLSRLPKSFL